MDSHAVLTFSICLPQWVLLDGPGCTGAHQRARASAGPAFTTSPQSASSFPSQNWSPALTSNSHSWGQGILHGPHTSLFLATQQWPLCLGWPWALGGKAGWGPGARKEVGCRWCNWTNYTGFAPFKLSWTLVSGCESGSGTRTWKATREGLGSLLIWRRAPYQKQG